MSRTEEWRALAQRVADALPQRLSRWSSPAASCGVADAVSDVDLLLVPVEQVGLEAAFAIAGDAGLDQLDTGAGKQHQPSGCRGLALVRRWR